MSEASNPAKPFPVVWNGKVGFAAACWALSASFFVVEAIVRAAVTAPYSMTENYISDLGAVRCGTVTVNAYQAYVCSPLHSLMNGTYVFVGLLAMIGAIAGRAAWPRGKQATAGLILVAVAGFGAVVAGIFPEDVNLDLHIIGALLAVPMSNIGMLLLALALRPHSRALARFTMVMVVVGLLGLILTGMPDSGVGIGLAERMAGYPFEVWKTVIGVAVLLAWLRGSRGSLAPRDTSGLRDG